MNRRDKSTDGRRAPRCALPTSTARQPANPAPAIFRARAARRFRATYPADGRTELPSSGIQLFLGFVIFRDQPLQQANAIARTPAVIDLGFRCAHRRSRDIEVRPRRVVDETLQELRGGDR